MTIDAVTGSTGREAYWRAPRSRARRPSGGARAHLHRPLVLGRVDDLGACRGLAVARPAEVADEAPGAVAVDHFADQRPAPAVLAPGPSVGQGADAAALQLNLLQELA